MSEPKLCPFRDYVSFEAPGDVNTAETAPKFAPCLEGACAMWRSGRKITVVSVNDGITKPHRTEEPYGEGWCGLAGKP